MRKRHTSHIGINVLSPTSNDLINPPQAATSPNKVFLAEPAEDSTPKKVQSNVQQEVQNEKVDTPGNSSEKEQGKTPEKTKKETAVKEVPVINMSDFSQVDTDEKLNLIMVAINKMNTNFHHKFEQLNNQLNAKDTGLIAKVTTCQQEIHDISEVLNDESDGVLPRMRDIEETLEVIQDRLDKIEDNSIEVQNDLVLLRGVVQVHERQITSSATKIVDLTARSMSQNIVISGLAGDTKDEKCKDKVLAFMRDKMLMEVNDNEIVTAHRLGEKMVGKLRQIVVRCKFDLRIRIFKYTKNLKDKQNEFGSYYQVRKQLPEQLYTQERECNEKIGQIRKTNLQTTDEEKHTKYEVRKGSLYIHGKQQKKYIFPPKLSEVFAIDKQEQIKIDKIKLASSDIVTKKSSSFLAHAARIKNSSEIKLAYKKVKQLTPEADHIILSYVMGKHSGHHDSGEHGAGQKMSNILADRNTTNTAVFVSRVYSGIPLRHKRFAIIDRIVKQVLNNQEAGM